jgi:hypothetical protein
MVQHDSSLLPLHSSRLSIQKRYDKAEKITRNFLNLYCIQDFENVKSPMVAIPRGTNDGQAILRWIIFRGAWESCVSFNKSLRILCLFAPDSHHHLALLQRRRRILSSLQSLLGWWYNPQNTQVSRKTLMGASKRRTLTLIIAENGHHQSDTPVVCCWSSFSLLVRGISSGRLC